MSLILSNAHTHSSFCDGKADCETMAAAAYSRGFKCLGFSGHSYTPFDTSYCMSRESTEEYIAEVARLKELYRRKMDIICGLELDYYAPAEERQLFEYVIGSVHYFYDKSSDAYFAVDGKREEFDFLVREVFSGDALKLCAAYYENIAAMAKETKPDIVGHIDLVRKLNGGRYLDEDEKRYLSLAYVALSECVKHDLLIEVNWGAVYQGYCDSPYPAAPLLRMLKDLKARLIYGADAHCPEALDFGLIKTGELLKAYGFTEIWALTGEGFEAFPLK